MAKAKAKNKSEKVGKPGKVDKTADKTADKAAEKARKKARPAAERHPLTVTEALELDPRPVVSPDAGLADMAERVSINIRASRKARGLSLEGLSQACGVSRAALSQIETGKSNPSLGAVWKIATGLGVPLCELLGEAGRGVQVLRRGEMEVMRSADGFESRPLTRAGALSSLEAYELILQRGARHDAQPHAPGTRELLVLLSGRLRLVLGPSHHELEPGDSVVFSADVPHTYENHAPGETHAHNVLLYTR